MWGCGDRLMIDRLMIDRLRMKVSEVEEDNSLDRLQQVRQQEPCTGTLRGCFCGEVLCGQSACDVL